jgi:lipopolysaccharide export system permease protein
MQVKPKILTRFLMRRWLSGLFLVLLIVCGVIFSITFIEKMPSSATTGDALWTAWVLLLQYIPLFLPLATFMGTLVATYNLTRSSESVIISGAGLSPYQSSKPFLIAAFFVGLFAAGIMNPYAVSVAHRDKSQEYIELTDGAVWLRETVGGQTFTLRATGMQREADGNLIFTGAAGFTLDSESKFISRIETNRITLSENGFSARNVTVFLPDGQPRVRSNWTLPSLMTPESVMERHLRPTQVSIWRLPSFIKNMNNMGLNSRGHRIQLWTLLFLPLMLVSMATLGVAFSQTRQRRNYKFGPKFSAGILTCFILYFIINVFGALGTSGALPTLLAVLAPPLIVLFGAAIFIVSFDTI